MALIFVLLGIALLIFTIVILVNWSCHKEMITINSSNNYTYGRSNFKKFKEEFDKIEWVYNKRYSDSLFNKSCDSECHANIILFNNKGMILGPISFFRSQLYVRKIIKSLKKDKTYVKNLWKKQEIK